MSVAAQLNRLTSRTKLLDKTGMAMDNAEPSLFWGKIEWGSMPHSILR